MASTFVNPISSSTRERRWTYDVFLSFRGKDTRSKFISHLCHGLKRWGINAFIDTDGLERGKKIGPGLSKAIEGSRIAIVVFSKDYASSTWCLDELFQIVEGTELRGQALIPIFYEVEPSDVRWALGSFEKALEEHKQYYSDTQVQKWKEALWKASYHAGECSSNWKLEADMVEKIAQKISERIGPHVLLHIANNPVGLESKIGEVKRLLMIGSPQVVFIGIVGIGGVGKTTLAKAVYNMFAEDYKGCSYLANIRETTEQHNGLAQLQQRLLSDILGGEKIDVANEDSGCTLIKDRLWNRRCLIVLDDVDKPSQIDALAGGKDWFGPGSRIIITTRDKRVPAHVRASIHPMGILDSDHARELLSWSAFREPSPPADYFEVFSKVLDYAKGLPLALTILGSSLYDRSVSDWKSTIQKLRRVPNPDICRKLKISYDGLTKDEKAIFLHIVCFFKGREIDDVVKILNACGYDSEIGITLLKERSLVTIRNRRHPSLDMHDLIGEMGKKIASEEKSLLWTSDQILPVLEDNTGDEAIQAIYLNNYQDHESLDLNLRAFEKMTSLRMLILYGCEFLCGPSSLPNALRWLEWVNYPSPSLPPAFNPRNLVALILPKSRITKLWDDRKSGLKLTVINLVESRSLLELPDVSGMPELKELRARCCDSLVKVHESVGSREKLEYLSFDECRSLTELPTTLRLPALQHLGLWGCEKLMKFPDILVRMEHVEILYLYGTMIKELPPSIEKLAGLRILSLTETDIRLLPRSIYHLENLKVLDLNDCKSLYGFMEKREDIRSRSPLSSRSFFPNLVDLHLQWSNITFLSPLISKCYSLKKLDLSWSNQLKEIPELPSRLMYLYARGCESLETIRTESLGLTGKIIVDLSDCRKLRGNQELGRKMLLDWLKGHEERTRIGLLEDSMDEPYHFEALIPGMNIPCRFYHGRNGGREPLAFWVHSQVLEQVSGFVVSAAFIERHQWSLNINGNEVFAHLVPFNGLDHVWIVYLHFKQHWRDKMVLNGWNLFCFKIEPYDNHFSEKAEFEDFLKSFGASFISRSGENLNFPTKIKFLRPVVAMENSSGVWKLLTLFMFMFIFVYLVVYGPAFSYCF